MDNPGSADLTRQEHIVLQLVADDYPAKQIAQLLRISDRTVNFHLGNARRKLGVGSTEAAVSRAAALNIIRVIVYDKERIENGANPD